MNCIVCKQDSSKSKSVEHIVPESLGNKNHILPKGTLCDKCNSYFSLKIEKKTLELNFFTTLRHRNRIESKKGRIPKGIAIIPKTLYKAEVRLHKKRDKPTEVILDTESFELIKEGKINQLIIPVTAPEIPLNNESLSRFLAKIGYEMMVSALIDKPSLLIELVDDSQLDPLREYIRYNSKKQIWLYSARQIYGEKEIFHTQENETFDMVFESTFLATEKSEIYFVIALKGFEFVINMGGDSIDGYKQWLAENNHESPLYIGDKQFGTNLTPDFLK